MKIDKTVIKETLYIAAFVVFMSAIMQAVCICLNIWNYTLLLGNLWGAVIAVANFFAMGLFVQRAVSQTEEEARKTLKISQTVRFLGIIVLLIVGVVIPVFNTVTVAVPLGFPGLGIYLRPLIAKLKK